MDHRTTVSRAQGRVRVNPPDNGSEIKCEVINPASTKPKVTSTRLSVQFPPRELIGSLEPEVAEEGSRVTLTCLTSSSNPQTNITWTSQDSLLPTATVTTSPAAFGGSSTRSKVVMVVQASDHGRHVTCEASNGFGSSLQKSFVLNVLHAPVWREKPPKEVNVWEGSEVSISASASANPGPVRYWWRHGEETLLGAGGTLHLGLAKKSMTSNYSVSAYSQRGAINTSFFINVQYGPDSLRAPDKITVSEGETVNIRCSGSGNPLPSLTWMSGNKTVGSGVGVARLVLQSAQREDTGLYMCQATGNLPSKSKPAATKLIVTQPVSISEEDNEVKGSWASLGGKGRLVCQVRAAPPPTFLWTSQEGMKIQNSDKYFIHKPVEVDGLVTWSSVLEVSDVTPQDYQTYHCSATNTLGSGSITLTLIPPSRPFPPTNLTVISVSNVSVVLGWSPNLAGSRPLGYTVKYHPTGTQTFQYEEVSEGSSTGVEVGGLTPEVEYSLTAQAKNNQGRSDYVTPPVIVTTLGGVEGVEDIVESHMTSFLVLVIIMSVFGLLVLNAIAIACFLRHRIKRKSLRGAHSTKSTSATTLGNAISDPDHRHHHHHNQVLLTLHSLSRKKNKKSKAHTRQGIGRQASVIPLPSPSSQRHKMIHFGRFNKHTAVTDKSHTTFTHNGKIPKPPPIQGQNNFSTAQAVQGLPPASSKPIKRKKAVTRSPGASETRSLLVAHNQEKIIPPKPQPPQKEQDELSESSHESTQTAIFCEESVPVSPVTTGLERQIIENQRTSASVQLHEEMKQRLQNRIVSHPFHSDEEYSKSLEYINLDHSTGEMRHVRSVSGHYQGHSQDHLSLMPKNPKNFNSHDTSSSSECHLDVGNGPMSPTSQEKPASYHPQEVQVLSSPVKNITSFYPPPVVSSTHHWPPPSPNHIQQHRIHSASSSRIRMGHQSPESPSKTRQRRAVSYSPTISRQRNGTESPPSVRHRRTPSQSPVRVVYIPERESPVRSSSHMRPPEAPVRLSRHMVSSESPIRYSHHMFISESPQVIRHQYRTPSKSPVRNVEHSCLSESTAKDMTRINFDSPQKAADHLETLKSPPIKENSDSIPFRSLNRSKQQLTESPTNDIQHQIQSESPEYREYQRAPPEPSIIGGHRYRLPLTHHTRIHQQNPVQSTVGRMHPVHTLPESPSGHQHHHPQSPLRVQGSQHSSFPHTSLMSHQNSKPMPTYKSSETDVLSVELNAGTQSASFSPERLNAVHPPLTPSNSGRPNLPPTPPRSKKPRPLHPSSSQPTLLQPSPRLQSRPLTKQLSPEEISTSFVLAENSKTEDKQHQQLPSILATKKSVHGVNNESRMKFRELVKGSPGSPTPVRSSDGKQREIQTERLRGESAHNLRTLVTDFASANHPIATSSPLTHRRRARFPDDFLWQNTSGKL